MKVTKKKGNKLKILTHIRGEKKGLLIETDNIKEKKIVDKTVKKI